MVGLRKNEEEAGRPCRRLGRPAASSGLGGFHGLELLVGVERVAADLLVVLLDDEEAVDQKPTMYSVAESLVSKCSVK